MRVAVALALLGACGSSHKAKPVDAPVDVLGIDEPQIDAPPDADPLADLYGTGLCMDKACTAIRAGIDHYAPRYALWADAASKNRWIYLPPGTQIDTTDPDHWVFPQGTKVWKEFTSGATRVETRFIEKVGPGNTLADWYYMGYQWNATNDDATAVPYGASNVDGTMHDIPSVAQCKACHENVQPTRLLGFGAIQLDAAPAVGDIALDDLISAGRLTTNPPGASSPHYGLTNDTANTYAPDALGYLHANCGHCHNPTSNVYMFNGVHMELRLTVATLGAVSGTPAYTTAVNQDATINCCPPDTKIIVPTDPTHSVMIDRFESTNPAIWMPQLGHKTMDPDGDTLLKNWITNL